MISTNILLSVTIFNFGLVGVNMTNTVSTHIYSMQQNTDLSGTNWNNVGLFQGNDGAETFFVYEGNTNVMFYRVQDFGQIFPN